MKRPQLLAFKRNSTRQCRESEQEVSDDQNDQCRMRKIFLNPEFAQLSFGRPALVHVREWQVRGHWLIEKVAQRVPAILGLKDEQPFRRQRAFHVLIVLEKKLLSKEELDRLLAPENMIG